MVGQRCSAPEHSSVILSNPFSGFRCAAPLFNIRILLLLTFRGAAASRKPGIRVMNTKTERFIIYFPHEKCINPHFFLMKKCIPAHLFVRKNVNGQCHAGKCPTEFLQAPSAPQRAVFEHKTG